MGLAGAAVDFLDFRFLDFGRLILGLRRRLLERGRRTAPAHGRRARSPPGAGDEEEGGQQDHDHDAEGDVQRGHASPFSGWCSSWCSSWCSIGRSIGRSTFWLTTCDEPPGAIVTP